MLVSDPLRFILKVQTNVCHKTAHPVRVSSYYIKCQVFRVLPQGNHTRFATIYIMCNLTRILAHISHKQARESLKVPPTMPFKRSLENALCHFLLGSEIMLKLNLSRHYRNCTAQLVRNAGLGRAIN